MIKNVIMKFQFNPLKHFQDTRIKKNFNQKLQPIRIYNKNLSQESYEQKRKGLQESMSKV